MPFALHLEVFDPDVAAKKRQPYELQWSINSASDEQLFAAMKLLEVIARKIEQVRTERFEEVNDGFSETWPRSDHSGQGHQEISFS